MYDTNNAFEIVEVVFTDEEDMSSLEERDEVIRMDSPIFVY